MTNLLSTNPVMAVFDSTVPSPQRFYRAAAPK
jgi:hypothetical protein